MTYCPQCENFYYTINHDCGEPYLVWCEADHETIEDAMHIYASDPKGAAEKWAEKRDFGGGEHRIVSQQSSPVLSVTKQGVSWKFEVTGEAVPAYTARPVS